MSVRDPSQKKRVYVILGGGGWCRLTGPTVASVDRDLRSLWTEVVYLGTWWAMPIYRVLRA